MIAKLSKIGIKLYFCTNLDYFAYLHYKQNISIVVSKGENNE